MNAKFTPGPWHPSKAFGRQGLIGPDIGYPVAAVTGYYMSVGQTEANARLIAAAPDHAAIAWAVCSGIARWDSFRTSDGGEFCINGLRHATKLDEFGVPVMTGGMRAAIAAATGESLS